MLDERTSRLLDKINCLCGESGYKIAEEGDLLSCLPQSDKEELSRLLRYLEERHFIDVKYAEEGVYCLCPLPEGRLYFERAREQRFEVVRRRRELFLWSFLGALAGGLLSAILTCVLVLWVAL